MKKAAVILIWISMIMGCILIFPVIVGLLALKKLKTAKTKDELQMMAILTLLFCNTIAGILMLCISDADLAE